MGLVRLYTGDGKGKTCVSLGLAVRYAGAGKNVFIGQFIKDDPSGDIMALRKAVPGIVTAQFGCGSGCICGRDADGKDLECAKKGLERARAAISSSHFGLVILDEITIPMYFGLISMDDIKELVSNASPNTDIVFTGRYASDELRKFCDFVTVLETEKMPDTVPEF